MGAKVTTKSLLEYYKNTYNITIKDKTQPIFKAADNRRVKAWDPNKPQSVVFLVPELVEMQGNSELSEKEKNRGHQGDQIQAPRKGRENQELHELFGQ